MYSQKLFCHTLEQFADSPVHVENKTKEVSTSSASNEVKANVQASCENKQSLPSTVSAFLLHTRYLLEQNFNNSPSPDKIRIKLSNVRIKFWPNSDTFPNQLSKFQDNFQMLL